jgi:hypothetical protein
VKGHDDRRNRLQKGESERLVRESNNDQSDSPSSGRKTTITPSPVAHQFLQLIGFFHKGSLDSRRGGPQGVMRGVGSCHTCLPPSVGETRMLPSLHPTVGVVRKGDDLTNSYL